MTRPLDYLQSFNPDGIYEHVKDHPHVLATYLTVHAGLHFCGHDANSHKIVHQEIKAFADPSIDACMLCSGKRMCMPISWLMTSYTCMHDHAHPCADGSRLRISSMLGFWAWEVSVYVYKLCMDDPEDEDGGCAAAEAEDTGSMYREWNLPHAEFSGLWESLHHDDQPEVDNSCPGQTVNVPGRGSVKERLLQYTETAMLFAERGVCSRLVSWNRVVGIGMTSSAAWATRYWQDIIVQSIGSEAGHTHWQQVMKMRSGIL
eukprot:357733-Chlamydomonas_euryale.AAC.10